MSLRKIYFAGKIGPEDWRTEIFGGRVGGVTEAQEPLDPTFGLDMDGFIYSGPFFVACDHKCAHVPTQHGVAITPCTGAMLDIDKPDIRKEVFELSQLRIKRSDYVFAYVNELDCYGTLVEIGMAHQMGKRVGLGVGPALSEGDREELWYALRCANAGVLYGPPEKAWHDFSRKWLPKVAA